MLVQRDMTIPQLARELGVSRIAVWNRVKAGKIPAQKIGAQYVIKAEDANVVLGRSLTEEHRRKIHDAVSRVVKEYGPVLKRLSRE
jgi:excisionase family DNA binding protein